MARPAWMMAVAGTAAVVAMLLVHLSPGTAAQPSGPPSPLPPLSALPFPPVLQLVLQVVAAPTGTVFSNRAVEAPMEFRLNAAAFAPTFDCVGVYAPDDRRYTTWDGRPVRRAPSALRTDEALAFCMATVVAAVTDHLYGDGEAERLYAAAASGGFTLPRLNDTACARGTMDASSPGCFGVAAVRRYIAAHLERDGMNADGRAGLPPGAPPRPFADTTSGYRPVNGPAAGVTALTRWVPLLEDLPGFGTYTTQTVTAAQTAGARPVLVPRRRLQSLRVPPPYTSPDAYAPDFRCGTAAPDPDRLCDQARGVLEAGADLSPRQRLLIRWFDRKSQSIAFLPPLLRVAGMPLADYLTLEFALNAFTWDATVAVWAEKVRHDAVRPASLVPSILRGSRRGRAFTSAIRTMPHQEYPSASAALCAGFSHILRAAGGDTINLSVPLPAGAVGGGLPATDTVLTFGSTAEMAAECGESRLHGGLHFPAAVREGARLGVAVAKEVLRAAACRAPGAPGLPPCEGGGGGGREDDA